MATAISIWTFVMRTSIGSWSELTLNAKRRHSYAAGYNTPRGYYGGKADIVTDNELNHEFDVEHLHQRWVTDITNIKTHEGFLFLAVVMDLFARKVISWSMSDKKLGLASHYGRLLSTKTTATSISRSGNCHDKAVAESFFSNLKKKKYAVVFIRSWLKPSRSCFIE